MQGRFLSLLLMALLLLPSFSAHAFMGHAKENNDPYFYRHNRSHRVDPRLKYVQSRKTGNCLRSATGICTFFNEKEDFASSRYQNSIRLKQEQKQRKIRPWL